MRQSRVSRTFQKVDLPFSGQKAQAKPSKRMYEKVKRSIFSLKNQLGTIQTQVKSLLKKKTVKVANDVVSLRKIKPIIDDKNQSIFLNYQNLKVRPQPFREYMMSPKLNRQSGKVLEHYKTDVSQLKEASESKPNLAAEVVKNLAYGQDGSSYSIYKKFFSFLKKGPSWRKNENVASLIEQRNEYELITQEKDNKLHIKNIELDNKLLQALKAHLRKDKKKTSKSTMDSNILTDSDGQHSFLITLHFKNGGGHMEDVENNWPVKDNGNLDAMDCVSRSILRLTSNNLLPLFESALDEAQKDKAYWKSLWSGYEHVTAKVFNKQERALSPQELKETCRKIKTVVKSYVAAESKENFEDFIQKVNKQFKASESLRKQIPKSHSQNFQSNQDFLPLHEWRSAVNFVRALIVKENLDSGELTYTPETRPILDHLDKHEAYNPADPSFSKKLYYGTVYKFWRRFNKLLSPWDISDKESRRENESSFMAMPVPIFSKERLASRRVYDHTIDESISNLQAHDLKNNVFWREVFPTSTVMLNEKNSSYVSLFMGKKGDIAFEEIINGHPIQHRHENSDNASPAQTEAIYKREIARVLLTNLLLRHFSLDENPINPDFSKHLFQGRESLADETYQSLLTYAAKKREGTFEDYLVKEKGKKFLTSYNTLVQDLAFQLDSRNENRPDPKISNQTRL